MIDSYIWGKVERISPEAPVPVISITNKEIRLGGAANVAKNVAALGATPLLCSVIGKDSDGKSFLDLQETRGMDTRGIVQSEDRMTTVKERMLSSSQQLLRIDRETTKPLHKKDKENLLKKVDLLIKEADVVIFEDYNKGVLDKKLIKSIVQLAQTNNIPTAVDPKKENFLNYENVTLFKPNLKEIKEGLKLDFKNDDEAAIAEASKSLRSKMAVEKVLITRSEHGVFISSNEHQHFIPAHVRSISDVSGAGDTVVSTASLCVALGLPDKFIAELSNLAGGLVCEHLGVVSIDKEQLLTEAKKYNL
ncbi:MAG: D-glycero-beta-D-manno-heptose-7-phosphate kinase [Cyclobacteriaceae bacterium]|nr:D-glycero-beta-D-manno-heptose-7-phosphate kinase [Cyclobacteriaceae bacterium]